MQAVAEELMQRLANEELLEVAPLILRPADWTALLGGRRLRLTRREYEVLELLARAPGRTVTCEFLRRAIWGEHVTPHRDRSVDVVIRRLRVKLAAEDPDRTYIHTHFHVGSDSNRSKPCPLGSRQAQGRRSAGGLRRARARRGRSGGGPHRARRLRRRRRCPRGRCGRAACRVRRAARRCRMRRIP